MFKKLSVLCVFLCVSTAVYAQGQKIKNLLETLFSKTSSNVTRQIERKEAQQILGTHPYTRTFYFPTGTLAPQYNGLLSSITLTETRAGNPPSIPHVEQLPSRPAAVTLNYHPTSLELQLLQDFIKEENLWIRSKYTEPAIFYAFISLVQKDVARRLNPADQKQLYKLFYYDGYDNSVKIDGLVNRLKEWEHNHPGTFPKLPAREHLMQRDAKRVYGEEWELAANIYLAQQVYGDQLPKVLQEVNVIPTSVEPGNAKSFRLLAHQEGIRVLKANQEKFALARENNQYENNWHKMFAMRMNSYGKTYYSQEEFANHIYDFYAQYIGFKNLPRVYSVQAPQRESIVLELPVKFLYLLISKLDGNLIQVCPEDFLVLHQDDGTNLLATRYTLMKKSDDGTPFFYQVIEYK